MLGHLVTKKSTQLVRELHYRMTGMYTKDAMHNSITLEEQHHIQTLTLSRSRPKPNLNSWALRSGRHGHTTKGNIDKGVFRHDAHNSSHQYNLHYVLVKVVRTLFFIFCDRSEVGEVVGVAA